MARDREVAELAGALAQVRQGGSAAVVVRGEPGTGKSALLAALASQARDVDVVRLRAPADGRDVATDWPRPLTELVGTAGVDEGPPEDLVAAVASAVDRLALPSRSPVVVSIDDAHLLPAPFLEGLVVAADKGAVGRPVLVVVAVCDTPHVPAVSLPLAPGSVLRLGGLTVEQAATLLERFQGRHLRHATLRALVHAVGGNPQALLSVAASLGEDVQRGWRHLPDPVPLEPSLRGAFARGLERLPSETRRALTTLAAGRAPLAIVEAALAELGLERPSLGPAIEAGIVVAGRRRITFAHPLVRAAAYHGASEDARVAAHRALATAYAAAGLVEASAAHGAAGAGSTAAVLGVYGQAVHAALDRADVERAAAYEEEMADIADAGDATIAYLVRAAAWWIAAGELDRAVHCLERASRLPATDEQRGSLVYWRARAQMAVGVNGCLADDLAKAARLVPRDASGSAALMLGEATICLLVADEPERADELARRALASAGAAGGFPEAFAEAVAASVRIIGRLGDEGGDRLRRATSFLVAQPDTMALSPLFATVVGLALLEREGARVAESWADWLEQSAATTGNASLAPVSALLGAHVALRRGAVEQAARLARAGADSAEAHGQRVIAVRALGALLEAQSLRGDYQAAFVTASRLFADVGPEERPLRAWAYRSLAELEVMRDRVPAALSWLKAAELEATTRQGRAEAPVDARRARFVATLAEALVHDGRLEAVAPLVDLAEQAARLGAIAPAWGPALSAVVAEDLIAAEEGFAAALRLCGDEPVVSARVRSLYGYRLAVAGQSDRAAYELQQAASTMRELGALGWAGAFEAESERLDAVVPGFVVAPSGIAVPNGSGDAAASGEGISRVLGAAAAREARGERLDPRATWEIAMLGSFSLRRGDDVVSMPTSLAATALKLVALRRRILVEELVEELWPESAPGVGMRRLRNVLWRVRVACGDILVREDKLIVLSSDAVTDVEVFRRLAVQALDSSTPEEKAALLARQALAFYGGELLPTDRYADWAAATRESLSRLKVQLIELLVHQAVTEDRTVEALGLLDQLVEADPYEEGHYVTIAELHEKAGNRRRALATLNRAERVLADLGIPPSPVLRRLSQRLR